MSMPAHEREPAVHDDRSSRGGSGTGARAGLASQRIRVPRVSSCDGRRATSLRVGWKAGTGAPAHTSTRTSTRSAASARSSPIERPRSLPHQLEVRRDVPAGDVDVVARVARSPRRSRGTPRRRRPARPASTRRGAAGRPSPRSRRRAGRGARPQPRRRRRQACLARTAASTPSPTRESRSCDQRTVRFGHPEACSQSGAIASPSGGRDEAVTAPCFPARSLPADRGLGATSSG